jgi:glutamyl-tRNA synthetase
VDARAADDPDESAPAAPAPSAPAPGALASGAGAGRGRFAPSPSGELHLGNARTALLAWARARSLNQRFVMRVEDLDGPRTVASAVLGNLAELRWLGLDWDEGPDVGGPTGPYLQSQRGAHYGAALAALEARGEVFACYLSRRDLREAASAPHGPAGPVYGPAERERNARLAPERRAAGRVPSLRFQPPPGVLELEDALHGRVAFDATRDVGAPVVRRADGLWAYALAVVVDDAAMAVSEVVRGDDLLSASGAQLALARSLGLPTPRYLHVPLLLDADGVRLAKRRGDRTLRALREAGNDPARLRGALLTSAGLLAAPRPLSPGETVAAFDLRRLSREPARWDHALEAFALGD